MNIYLGSDTVKRPKIWIVILVVPAILTTAMADDTNNREVGVEWVEEYNGHGSNVRAAYISTCSNQNDYLPGFGSVGDDENPPSCLVYGYWEC
ncbi:hypothetical protein [Archaeoglobus neptunius]|uniref:hypothetical protein n=1 Tax=Archaeoglobus neptunius TaxID=2798580 RepID=UPI0019289DB1|nr:hypothetical protein [Archaeoglobus neptunius]